MMRATAFGTDVLLHNREVAVSFRIVLIVLMCVVCVYVLLYYVVCSVVYCLLAYDLCMRCV